jgi:hypothetical protein
LSKVLEPLGFDWSHFNISCVSRLIETTWKWRESVWTLSHDENWLRSAHAVLTWPYHSYFLAVMTIDRESLATAMLLEALEYWMLMPIERQRIELNCMEYFRIVGGDSKIDWDTRAALIWMEPLWICGGDIEIGL